jgi:hypothetical protein
MPRVSSCVMSVATRGVSDVEPRLLWYPRPAADCRHHEDHGDPDGKRFDTFQREHPAARIRRSRHQVLW